MFATDTQMRDSRILPQW